MDTSFGKAERKLRLLKNIEAKELACKGIISYQQILKFENGETMISADKLAYLLDLLNVSPDEYEHCRYTLVGDPKLFYSQQVDEAFWSKNTLKLKALISEAKKKVDETPNNNHYFRDMIELKTILNRVDCKFKIPQKDIARFTKYLLEIKGWSLSDISLFINCTALFSDKQLRDLVDHLIHPQNAALVSFQTQSKINTALSNVISLLIASKHFSPIPELMTYLDAHLHYDTDLYNRAVLTYHKALFEWYQEPKNAAKLDKVQKCINAFETLGCYDLANFASDEVKRYQFDSQI